MTTAIGIAMMVWGAFHAYGLANEPKADENSLIIAQAIFMAITTASFIFGIAIVIGANV